MFGKEVSNQADRGMMEVKDLWKSYGPFHALADVSLSVGGREDRILIRPKVEAPYQAPLVPEKTFAAFHSPVLLVPEAILII
ncbi:MAG: hypothetical protein ACWGSD_02575, partial [Thermodesulfobacteriota bacterium]